jgi:glycosyltransferase involved in cell wall biosynthesis
MAAASVLVYPGDMGFGRKNTDMEAWASGRPVVASEGSARGKLPASHLLVGGTIEELAAHVIRFLSHDDVWSAACSSAAEHSLSLPHWDDVSRDFDAILNDAASGRVVG